MSLQKVLKRSSLAIGLLGGSIVGSGSAIAGENLSGYLSLDYNSHFMSYGANVWGQDTRDIGDEFLFQPSLGLEFALPNDSAIYTGVWADVNRLADSNIGRIQEIDVWLGYYFPVGDFILDFTVQQWLYAGETEGIFDIKLSYDGMFSPYLLAHNRFETVGPDQQKGTIFELGATVFETAYHTIDLSFPVGVGFSFDDYHVAGEDGYGYSFIGANFSMPIEALQSWGAWDFHGGLTFWHTDKSFTGNDKSTYLTLNLGVGVGF